MDASNALILEAQTDFALNLLREVSKDGRSCIVSPFSVAIALSMVYAGAKEKTSQEMVQLLAKGAPESKVHEYFGELVKAIQKGSSNYTLEVANKVYVKEGFSVIETFKTMINRHYGGQFEAINFEKAVDSAKKINKFVEKATHDKIHDLIKPDMFDVNTRLVLINAVYFKGNWAEKFDAHRTQKKTFHIDANNKKELDMMHKKDEFIYFEDDQLQLLGMPYKGGEVFMFVLLPKERFGLDKMLAKLDGKSLLELLKKRSKQEVEVELPKFKLESAHDLNEPLEKLGMPTAFTDSANFAGILPGHQLKISKVVQKAFIEVNESGTEAAAATFVGMVAFCSAVISPPPVEFVADRPFAAFLVDQKQNALFSSLFRG